MTTDRQGSCTALLRGVRGIAAAICICVIAFPAAADAETGAEAWLRYSALTPQAAKIYEDLPRNIVVLGDSSVLKTAQQELVRGVAQMLGKTLRAGAGRQSPRAAIVLGNADRPARALAPALHPPQELQRRRLLAEERKHSWIRMFGDHRRPRTAAFSTACSRC